MDNDIPLGTIILFFSFVLLSFTRGGKTSSEDEEIDDYWSDG
jgi:hypothetical protein